MEKNYQVVFTAQKVVELLEVEIPKLAHDEVLIKTDVSQISTGTELTQLEKNVDEDSIWNQKITYPVYPGYSNVGTVVDVGTDVDRSLIGKRVITAGNHVKYFSWPVESTMIAIPDSVDSDEAVFKSMAQITLGSIRAAEIRPGDTVAVYGAGLIGQFVARFAKLAGAIKVFVVDLSDFRLNKLPDAPCYIKVNSGRENVPEFIKSYNNDELARIVFETTGNQNLIERELECIALRGKLIITSSPKGKSLVNFDYCSRNAITIIGALNAAIHTPVATPENPWTKARENIYYMELLEKSQFPVKSLITHKANYKQATEMYEMLMRDRAQAMAVNLYWED